MRIESAQPNIEKVFLSKTPSVTLHIRTEIKFRNLFANRAPLALAGGHLELDLLGCNGSFVAGIGPQVAGYGAKMPAGPYHEPCLNLAIGDPRIPRSFEACQGHAFHDARAAAPEQEFIKFKSSDPVADGSPVPGLNLGAAYDARAESGDRLENVLARIFKGIDLQLAEHRGRDPSAAGLVAGKHALVHDRNIEAPLPQSPRTRRTRRACADDQDIACIHLDSFVAAGRCS